MEADCGHQRLGKKERELVAADIMHVFMNGWKCIWPGN